MSHSIEEILERLQPVVAEEPVDVNDELEGEQEDLEGEQSEGQTTEPVQSPEEVVRELAETLERDQKLADELWKSGVPEARLLATSVADPSAQDLKSITALAKDVDSSALVEHLCENLIAETELSVDVIDKFVSHKDGFTKAIGFGAMACAVMREAEPQTDMVEDWLLKIADGAEDDRAEVRAAVLWALLEIGKVDQYWQDAAIVLACELQAESQTAASLGHEAEEILNNTTLGHRRLASGNSKSGRNNNQSQNNKRRGGKNNNRRGRGQQKQNADASGAKKPARRNGRNKRRSRTSTPKTV